MTVRKFIRHTPTRSLRRYFEQLGAVAVDEVNWDASDAQVRQSLIKAAEATDRTNSPQLCQDAERINAMADEAGQTALYGIVQDRAVLDSRDNGHDRALWLLLENSDQFRQAEEVRFTDERRRGRTWDGFVAVPGLDLRRDEQALTTFGASLAERFASPNVHVDVFDRSRVSFGGDDRDLVQLTIYREGLPDRLIEFHEGVLGDRSYHPLLEAAMTYEKAAGVIEVVSNDREIREDMVRIMARELLGHEFVVRGWR